MELQPAHSKATPCAMALFALATASLPLAARAIVVECRVDDKAVKFAAGDLERYLAGAKGSVELVEEPGLESQEWRIRAAGGKVTISGRDGMGVVYGAYEFLERHLGFRWYAPDVSRAPDMNGRDLSGLKIDERGRPAILEREMYVGTDYMDATWRLRNKETRRARFGVGVTIGSPRDCHTFAWYSDAIGTKGRPELMGVNDSGRPTGLFCPSRPEARRLVAEHMKKTIRSDREACRAKGIPAYAWPTVYELSQEDGDVGGSTCACPECKATFEAAGSWSGVNIAFVSAVAEDVAREFPDVVVRTFAYSYTEQPPTNDLRAAANVSARYCRSFLFQPLTAETDNGILMREWNRHVEKKHVWGYWLECSGVPLPMVKTRKDIGDELAFCREMNVFGYFAQDDAPLSRSFAMMQHWLFLKLAENPAQDVFALADEFICAYYGGAAKPVSEYLAYLERRQTECNAKISRSFLRSVNSGHLAQYVQKSYLDAEFFWTANALLDEAERLAAGDDSAALHVGHERLVVDRAMRAMGDSLSRQGYSPDFRAAEARTAKTLPELVERWNGFPPGEKSRRKAMARLEVAAAGCCPVALPPELAGRKVLQLGPGGIVPGFDDPRVVEDGDAAFGCAVAFPPAKQSLKPPFFAGGYNALDRKGCEATLGADRIPQDGKYHLIRLGTLRVRSPSYVYYNSWHYRTWLSTEGLDGEEREIWISAKFLGPGYVGGSTGKSEVRYDRIFLVEPSAASVE